MEFKIEKQDNHTSHPKTEKAKAKYNIFVLSYLENGNNATQAAKSAGYSEKTARQQGQRLLSNVYISHAIGKLIGAATEKSELSLDFALKELKSIASANMSDFAKWEKDSVELVPSAKLTTEMLSAVESVAEVQGKDGKKYVRIKLHSKLQAISAILRLYEISEVETRLAAMENRISKL